MSIEISNKRLGYGEPIALDGDNADIVRDLIEALPPSYRYSELQGRCVSLRGLLLPKPIECQHLRQQLQDQNRCLENLTELTSGNNSDDSRSPDALDSILTSMSTTYEGRPQGCEMEHNDKTCADYFECIRCDFLCDVEY